MRFLLFAVVCLRFILFWACVELVVGGLVAINDCFFIFWRREF